MNFLDFDFSNRSVFVFLFSLSLLHPPFAAASHNGIHFGIFVFFHFVCVCVCICFVFSTYSDWEKSRQTKNPPSINPFERLHQTALPANAPSVNTANWS